MKLPFFKKEPPVLDRFLTLDINSNSVRCLKFYLENNSVKITGYGKQELEPGTVSLGTILDKPKLIIAVKACVEKTLQNSEDSLNNVIVGVEGSLCLGLTTTVRVKRGIKSEITQREINEIEKKISEASLMQAQNEYVQSTADTDMDLDLITKGVVYSKVDGQKTEILVGKTGSNIEIAAFGAFSPSYHIKNLTEVVKKADLDILTLGSTLHCLSESIKRDLPENNDYVILDVGADCTSAAVVFARGIVATKSLPIGIFHFVEGIGEKMGLTFREAEKVFKGYTSGSLAQSEASIVQSCLKDTLGTWIVGVELLFQEFTGVKTFPSKVFLTGDGSEVPEILPILVEGAWLKSVPFKATPEIRKLGFLDFKNLTDATGKITSQEWVACACLSSIFLEIRKETR